MRVNVDLLRTLTDLEDFMPSRQHVEQLGRSNLLRRAANIKKKKNNVEIVRDEFKSQEQY